jgi:hypothetical protein
MTTQAQTGFGTLFQIDDGAGTYTTVAEVVNITAPDSNLNTTDATHMESDDGFSEAIPTLLDSGEASLDLNFIPGSASQKMLDDAHFAKRRALFRIILPGALKRCQFAGYVTKVGRSFPHNDKMVKTVAIKATGKVEVVDNV